MPWSDYSPDVRPFSGLIQWAAQQGFTSSQTLATIAENARGAGLSLSFQGYQDAVKLFSQYRTDMRASDQLAVSQQIYEQLGQDQAITADHYSFMPWSQDQGSFNLNPQLSVRWQYQEQTPEGTRTGWFTIPYNLSELNSVGQLQADAQAQLDAAPEGTWSPDASLTGQVHIWAR
jgi:hypothetical protein